MRTSLLIGGAVLASVASTGQVAPQGPTFEVTSIRKSEPGSPGYFNPTGDGFRAGASTVKLLIATGYKLQAFQISGGPAWTGSEEFDVIVKADHAVSGSELLPMLQNLLADRFKLRMHKDLNALSGYELVLAKGGPKLREATGTRAQVNRGAGTKIDARHVGFSSLVEMIQRIVGKPVVDRTNIQGAFDFTLEWAREDRAPLPGDGVNDVSTQAPSIFTAVQEQLGLKLEPISGAGDLYVIDQVEHPSEN